MYYKDYSIDKYAKGGIFKDKLLGSSPNYDGILKLLKQFFYSPNIFLTEGEIGGNYYVINNSKGVVNDYYVFFSKGRYRFFEKDKMGFDERMQEQRDKSEVLSKNSKLKNKNFVESMQNFLENNNIKGTATTYGFSISKNFDYKEKVALVEKKLKELDIKYKTDFTNTWNVMFKVDKNQILNYKEDIKVTDESNSKNNNTDTRYLYAIPKWLIEEIKESVKLGYDKLVTGMISPKKRGLVLVNKDSFARGKYNLQLKIPIQKIIDESKTEDIEQVEIKKDTDIDYAKTIKEGNKYGDWSLMKFDPIKFNDDGSLSGGYIRLVNQDTLDKLEILNDLNLRGNKYFISYGGVQIIDKNPRTVIEKVLKLANKVIDESKTEDIEEKEINKGSNIDKEIKSLEIALKYSGANTRLRIEKEISSLKIAKKYETKNENALDKLKGNKEAKIVYDNLHDILALSDDEIISYKPKETYNDRLVDLALKIDKTMLTEAHAEWRTHIIRERNVKNLLYKLMNKNVDSTLKLLELVKTIPKYLHESIDIFQETYDRVLQGKINSDDGAIYLMENDYEVTNEIYDRLRLAEKRFQKNLRGLEVHDIITVKGKNGNKDFPANFRGFTNDGKLVVVYEGGKQMTINSDEYY